MAPTELDPGRPFLVPLVFEAVGKATMSWEHVDRAGVFAEQNAIQAAEAIIEYVRTGAVPDWFTQHEEAPV